MTTTTTAQSHWLLAGGMSFQIRVYRLQDRWYWTVLAEDHPFQHRGWHKGWHSAEAGFSAATRYLEAQFGEVEP
ncbi:MAG: hypothetical protein M3464_03310 [Chloroflexota bacterium]|nr:hypothetical protein [Chloroflexota bacterium]